MSCIRLPWWLSGKESACPCRRHGFDPWSQEHPSCRGTTKSIYHNYWALESENCNYWSLHTWSPFSATREAHTWQLESSPHLPQLEKSLSANEDPAQPKISKSIKKYHLSVLLRFLTSLNFAPRASGSLASPGSNSFKCIQQVGLPSLSAPRARPPSSSFQFHHYPALSSPTSSS